MRICPQCGGRLPEGKLAGVCPRYMLLGTLTEEPDLDANGLTGLGEAGAFPVLPALEVVPPPRFGEYELLEEIAHGGMGVVYRARQVKLDRIVAIKMILLGQRASAELQQRFQREAQAAAHLHHPGIVAIHEVGEVEGQPFFSMDFIEGKNLAQILEGKPLAARQAATYTKSIAEAVHFAHQQGVIHRDLKPSNVLVDFAENRVHLTDFGLARRLEQDSDLTLTGQVLGSPNHMAPELATGQHQRVGPRSDLYSLGAILYELLTGRPPFLAESVQETLLKIRDAEPVAPRVLNNRVPRDLETICLKCLQKEPDQRYATARELAEELDRFLRGEPIRARPISLVARTGRWCKRRPQIAGLSLALLVLGLAGFIAVLTQWRRAETLRQAESLQRVRADRTVHQLRLHQAAEYLANGRAAEGVALLASHLRRAPGDVAVAEWVATELTYRSFALPLVPALRHDRECTFAEFSPDGRFLLTVARDNAARVWVAATGELLSACMSHDPSVVRGDLTSTSSKPLEACFSPDGAFVVTASVDGTARVWDSRTGTPRTPPLAHPDWVSSARFSPDGQRVATTCRDGIVRLWDAAQGTQVGPVFRHAKWVNTVEFSADGARIVTAGDDGVALVWDVRTGVAVGKPLQHSRDVKTAVFSGDGDRIVTASADGTARIWQAATGDPIGAVLQHSAIVVMARFSPDGRWVTTGSFDRTARLWDTSTGAPASDPLRHRGVVRWVDFSPEGQRLLTASEDRTVRVWSVATGELLFEPIHHRGTVWAARFSPEGRRLVSASADGTAQVWDALPGAAVQTSLPVLSRGQKVSWSPDGRRILTVARSARLWNAQTGNSVVASFPESDARDAQFSPSGDLVGVAAGSGVARIRDGRTGEAVSPPLRHQGPVNSVEFSPDESIVATASEDGTACLWDFRSGSLSVAPLRHPAAVRRARFAPEGRRLATASADHGARIWDSATGNLLLPPLDHRAEVLDVVFSPDSRRLLTVSADSRAQVWEVQKGQMSGPPLQHEGFVTQAMFTPDSRWVLTASQDWKVRLWDPESGKLAAEPLQHDSVVVSLSLRGEGRALLTATRSGRLALWHDYREHPLGTLLDVGTALWQAVWSPDGLSVVAVGDGGIARVLRFPPRIPSAPEWLPTLAEAVVGRTESSERDLGFVAPEALLDLRHRLNALPSGVVPNGWAQWLLADKTRRVIDPDYQQLGLEGYIARIIDSAYGTSRDRLSSVREALCRAPGHGGLTAHYARTLLDTGAASTPAGLREAEWHSQRAIQLSPEDPEVWLAKAALSERAGNTNAAILAMQQVSRLGHNSPGFLLAVASLQERAGRPDDADESFRGAIAVAWARGDWNSGNCRSLSRQRAEFLLRQGRRAEARHEELNALGIPQRDANAVDRLVSLDAFYNAGLDDGLDHLDPWSPNLATLGKGRQLLGDTEFDIRGIVALRREAATNFYPDRVEGVPIDRVCQRLHFLHAADGQAADGTVVATYRVHLQSGETLELPVVYGKDVGCWDDETPQESLTPRVAWQGRCPARTRLRLFHTTWSLPKPGRAVVSLDFVSRTTTTAAPFLVAVTVE